MRALRACGLAHAPTQTTCFPSLVSTTEGTGLMGFSLAIHNDFDLA